jgi:hypothetical protein
MCSGWPRRVFHRVSLLTQFGLSLLNHSHDLLAKVIHDYCHHTAQSASKMSRALCQVVAVRVTVRTEIHRRYAIAENPGARHGDAHHARALRPPTVVVSAAELIEFAPLGRLEKRRGRPSDRLDGRTARLREASQ